ncbi:hypothetical protein MJM83_30965, partial [Salmonella enterica subsp. enterica serovar Montevideo]|nr:hypothetical protein [Salmonella enterica subsp. enterica serovar Montevideo]
VAYFDQHRAELDPEKTVMDNLAEGKQEVMVNGKPRHVLGYLHFRLQLTEPGLRPALEASCQEFSARFGFTVKLDYQLPPRLVPS